MKINVEAVTHGDLVSPIGGQALGKQIVASFKGSILQLDFTKTGSHTSLFFNAMLIELNAIPNLDVDKTIEIVNSTELDKDTFRRCKENFEQKVSAAMGKKND